MLTICIYRKPPWMAFSESDLSQLKSSLALYGQDHLLAFWNELSGPQKRHLYKDVQSINFKDHLGCFDRCMQKESSMPEVEEDLQPLPSDAFESVLDCKKNNIRWKNLGLKEISEGKSGSSFNGWWPGYSARCQLS